MDYDKTTIAASYDAARSYRPKVMRQWLDLIATHAPPRPQYIVDVGCGTGRFTQPLADLFEANAVGIDPSRSMLDRAREKSITHPGVAFRQGPAEELPLDDGSADLVLLSMVLHHLQDRARAARECRRILRTGGRVLVRNSTCDTNYPQGRFFPGMQTMIARELPARDEVISMFESVGLQLAAYQLVTHPVATSWHDLADKLAMRRRFVPGSIARRGLCGWTCRVARACRQPATRRASHRGNLLLRVPRLRPVPCRHPI